jgi:hypothetical protein
MLPFSELFVMTDPFDRERHDGERKTGRYAGRRPHAKART